MKVRLAQVDCDAGRVMVFIFESIESIAHHKMFVCVYLSIGEPGKDAHGVFHQVILPFSGSLTWQLFSNSLKLNILNC